MLSNISEEIVYGIMRPKYSLLCEEQQCHPDNKKSLVQRFVNVQFSSAGPL